VPRGGRTKVTKKTERATLQRHRHEIIANLSQGMICLVQHPFCFAHTATDMVCPTYLALSGILPGEEFLEQASKSYIHVRGGLRKASEAPLSNLKAYCYFPDNVPVWKNEPAQGKSPDESALLRSVRETSQTDRLSQPKNPSLSYPGPPRSGIGRCDPNPIGNLKKSPD
jgi:hypothetical protein